MNNTILRTKALVGKTTETTMNPVSKKLGYKVLGDVV